MIIEWNAHMFSSDTDRYPFHPRATYTPDAQQRSDLGDPYPLAHERGKTGESSSLPDQGYRDRLRCSEIRHGF